MALLLILALGMLPCALIGTIRAAIPDQRERQIIWSIIFVVLALWTAYEIYFAPPPEPPPPFHF